MLLDVVFTISGFLLLLWGADRFVLGGASLARQLGVRPVVIGVTIVGFGTSAPEIMVSASAAAQGLTAMAVGNAIGSNIANVGLVLGATALIRPFETHLTQTLNREIVLLVVLTAASALLFLDNSLTRLDAFILLAGFIAFMTWVVRHSLRNRAPADPAADTDESPAQDLSMAMTLFWLGVGLVILLVGANLLVSGAEGLARRFGMSELVIGITVLAVGTSLPELAVSLTAALRGNAGIGIGNIIGSNVFNLLAVIGVAGSIGPATLAPDLLTLHYPVMFLFTLALLRMAYNPFGQPGFSRPVGLILLVGFFAYQYYVITS